jgi:hypothetical protein
MSRTGRLSRQLRRCTGLGVAMALIVAGATACVQVNHYDKRPKTKVQKVKVVKKKHPHAADVELVFDSDLDVYVVVGHPGHYHDGHRFYRKLKGRWWVSTDLHDHWVVISTKKIPPGLQRLGKKGKKGRHPASRRR